MRDVRSGQQPDGRSIKGSRAKPIARRPPKSKEKVLVWRPTGRQPGGKGGQKGGQKGGHKGGYKGGHPSSPPRLAEQKGGGNARGDTGSRCYPADCAQLA